MKRNLLVAGLVGMMVIGGSTGVFADASKEKIKAYELVPSTVSAVGIENGEDFLKKGQLLEVSEAELKEIIRKIDTSKAQKITSKDFKFDEVKLIKSGMLSEGELKQILKNFQNQKTGKAEIIFSQGQVLDGTIEFVEPVNMDSALEEKLDLVEIIQIGE